MKRKAPAPEEAAVQDQESSPSFPAPAINTNATSATILQECYDLVIATSSKPISNPNPLKIHSSRSNSILTGCIDDKQAYYTCLYYNEAKEASSTEKFYNFEFTLPLICHLLNETNVCDGIKIVSNGWIYFIMKGLSLENDRMRSMAFLAYQRLLTSFHQAEIYRNQDAKIWLHFLNAIRRGIQLTGQPKISHVLATWIIAVCKVLKEPTNPMFLCITHCLFAKPTIEMTILPDFVSFYNSGDDNKESRTWLLSVLYAGLRTPEDWKIIQKSPFIKFLCSSFQLEKVKTQRTIVAILVHGTNVPEVVDEFIDKYSLLLWLGNVKTTNRVLKMEIENFFYILREKSNLNSSNVTASVRNTNNFRLREILFEFVAKKQGWNKTASVAVNNEQCFSEVIFSTETENGDQGEDLELKEVN